ncbi:8-oxo-dGTP pyrophosphatase MutT (NUDIX family) [Streptomyces sp. CZ24]|nr:8-oxo-dGTP pyrophosphatase MutT (NUDIX family) [Streptomyces sp. CZ24]
MTEQIVVVAAALRDARADGRGGPVTERLLAARRSAPPELAGRWELPGGKIEPGEQPEAALVRELRARNWAYGRNRWSASPAPGS